MFKKLICFVAIFILSASAFSQIKFIPTTAASLGIDSALGSGNVAFADINNDCYVDIFGAGRVWLNDGHGHFTMQSGAPIGTGVTTFGDYNNDGYPDALSAWGGNVHLFKNMGPPNFNLVNVDTVAGLDSTYADGIFVDNAWVDFDNDGWIDFYISNYENPLGVGHPDHFYKNNGDGTFTDISAAAGIDHPALCSRGISILDYNNDGLQDIFVSVYRLQPNLLWRNNGDGTFTDVAASTGVQGLFVSGYYGHNIGTAVGDYNNDGNMDLFSPITHHSGYPGDYTNHLWQNSGTGNYNFIDHANYGTYNAEIGSAPSWVDYDNDGDLDLYYVNLYGAPVARCWMYRNDGTSSFVDVTPSLGLPTNVVSNFGTFADINYDGFPDGFLPFNDVGQFYMSNAKNANHWLTIKLTGSATAGNTTPLTSNTMGIGAKITAYTKTRKVVRENNPNSGNGYGSMYVPFQYFGLGKDSLIDSLQIRWPSGHVDIFYDVAADTNLCITEYSSLYTSISNVSHTKESMKVYPNPGSGVFQIYNMKSQVSTIEIYNGLGERVYESSSFKANKSKIDITTQPAGIYYLRLADDKNEISTMTLIKN